ncbi:MAG: hypothetical protein EA376_01800 [Phycisphaeraceae bacterium]|nr:MAG: hypothetical protein EA376_01800 [Phycisphaeraceae bacterium]
MAKKTSTKKTSTKKATTKKKAPRMSASAARVEGAARQNCDRVAKKSGEAAHTGTVIRGDGKAVTVTVPPNEKRSGLSEAAEQVVVFRDGPGMAYRWQRGDSVSAKRYMAREQAERAAMKANPGAELVHEPDPPMPGANKKKPAKQRKSKQDHESPSAKELANDAHNEAFAQSKKSKATTPKKRAKAPKADTPKRISLLDAAATVLKDAKAPLQAKQIVDRVIERGLWTPGVGKTPHATLYAAMTREIAAKGKDSRFAKVDRGQFTAA